MTYTVSNTDQNQDIIAYLTDQEVFSSQLISQSLQDFSYYEFSLEELNLPTANELLTAILAIKDQVGLKGWLLNGVESKSYRGFSLTYNPDFHDTSTSINHQTWGSKNLLQIFGRAHGLGNFSSIRNTYYDTYAFRNRTDIVETHLGKLFNCFQCPLLRSRAAFLRYYTVPQVSDGWHVDEPPTHLFRINIPLQTSEEHVLEINGSDEYGNTLTLSKHLEVGKVYIWNTRIPHRVTITKPCINPVDRIHLVLGFGPWVDYDPHSDTFSKSSLHGLPLKTIIEEKMFLKRK